MSEPKFQVGDVVAVFCMEDGVIIAHPQTEVSDLEFVYCGELVESGNGETFEADRDAWYYAIVADTNNLYLEECLRKINPNSEYKDQPESVEQPA